MSDGILADKVVVVTGASAGIGADAVRVFAREGARLMITARREQELSALVDELQAGGGEAGFVAGDIADAATSQRLVDAALDRFGRIDGAFNNAGISGSGLLIDVPEEEFDLLWNVNVKGTWYSLRAEIRAMLAANTGGSIVNTSSISGIKGSVGLGSYQATKHAVIGLTRTASWDNAPKGIRGEAAAWLLSDRSGTITGTVLPIDGGFTA